MAIRVHEFGGAGKLEYEKIPRPEPDAGEVVVRVRGAGVNPIDWMVREGGHVRGKIVLEPEVGPRGEGREVDV